MQRNSVRDLEYVIMRLQTRKQNNTIIINVTIKELKTTFTKFN